MNTEKVCNGACGRFLSIFLIWAAIIDLDQLFLKLYKSDAYLMAYSIESHELSLNLSSKRFISQDTV